MRTNKVWKAYLSCVNMCYETAIMIDCNDVGLAGSVLKSGGGDVCGR